MNGSKPVPRACYFTAAALLGGLGMACGSGGASTQSDSNSNSGAGAEATGHAGASAAGASSSASGAATGGAAAAGGQDPNAAGGGQLAVAGSSGSTGETGPGATCADPTPKGTLDVPNVGSAATAIIQADLAGASPATHYYASIPGNLPPAGTADPAKQVGLFLVFHEHGSSPDVEMPSVTKALTSLGHAGDFVVLGLPIDPNTTTHPYTKDDHTRAKLLLDYALKTWPINPRRVYLWGRGEGATMSHQWGTENKAAIAAMITYSWGWDSPNWPSNSNDDQPDLYLVIGLADYPDSHVPLVRRVYGYAEKAGFNVIYREVPGLKGATAGALTNTDAVSWAIASRHKTQPLSTRETALVAPYADASAARGVCPDAAQFAALELVGGAQAGKVVPGLLSASTEATRLLAAQIVGRANFGDEADKALAARLADSSAAVRKQTLSSLGVAANWRNQAAQKALIDFATSSTAEVTERALAVDAIGVAVKYQIGGAVDTGAYQDPPLFLALVTLLGDSDATLRGKAFAILKPAMPNSSYDPAAAPAAQAAAIQAWADWQKTLKS
jgi:hypothetical protein